MNLRTLLGWGHRSDSIEEEPTRVGEDAFSEVANYYDLLMANVPYKQWVDYLERILSRWYANPHDVLDLCCGTGAVGWELARRGHNVVGADLSERMVRGCRRRSPPLPAAVMNAERLAWRSESFDMVVSLYDSLNYIIEPDGLRAAFEEVRRVLRPGGVFIFDMNTAHALRIGLFTQNNRNTGEPLQYDWRSTWDEKRQLCRVDMDYTWHGDNGPVRFHETHYERAYDIDEVRGMLRGAGLKSLAVYDAYSFHDPHRLSERLYYLACRERER
ncbi:MAG: class I SAM-dependent methyltransferase [Armatimonadetes bacterium]|nr:class I SAM-dependent methyltransferase [Armatimonadota bacterium]